MSQGALENLAPSEFDFTKISVTGLNWELVLAVAIGLVAGAVWRTAYLMNQPGGTWKASGRDLLHSLLAGGANLVLALCIVSYYALSNLAALATGTILGATGVRAIQWVQRIIISQLEQKFGASGMK